MDMTKKPFKDIVVEANNRLASINREIDHTTELKQLLRELERVMGDLCIYGSDNTVAECTSGLDEDEFEILSDMYNALGPYSDILRGRILERLKPKLFPDIENRIDTIEQYDYKALHEKLAPYISISTENLQRLIEGDNIKPGTSAKWIGKNTADAYRFAYWLSPKNSPRHKRFKAFFNNNITGIAVHENQRKDLVIGLCGSIWDVLKLFRVTEEIDSTKNKPSDKI